MPKLKDLLNGVEGILGWVKWVAVAKAMADLFGDVFPLPDDMTDKRAVEAWLKEGSPELVAAIVAAAKIIRQFRDNDNSEDPEDGDDFVVGLEGRASGGGEA